MTMPRTPADADGQGEPKNRIALAGSLPAAQANGLLAIVDDLCTAPGAAVRRYAVVEFYAMRRVAETDDGSWQAVVRLSQIEPLSGEDAALLESLMTKAQTERLGQLDFVSDPDAPPPGLRSVPNE